MKFAVDKMLGRLAKWLRILGFDTLFDPHVPTSDILQRTIAEKRILLTRDAKLAADRNLTQVFIVKSENYKEQLREVVSRFRLDVSSKLFTRCTICNEKIVPVDKELIKDDLPEKSSMNFESFCQCPRCKRIYWEGTHTENTRRRLHEIFAS